MKNLKGFLSFMFSWRSFVFALGMWIFYLPVVRAQNLVSFSLGGPTHEILVINDTTDNSPVLPIIGGRMPNRTIQQGGQWGRSYGFTKVGEIPILIQTCEGTPVETRTNQPPPWAANPGKLGSLAITREYLAENPSEPELKQRVKDIKKFIHHELGGREMEAELDEWFGLVKDTGLVVTGNNCEHPKTIAAKTFNWGLYYSYNAYDQVTMVILRGSREKGYHIEAPLYVQ